MQNPDKAIRSALMVARRARAPGGSLRDAMNSFSKAREAEFNRPSAAANDQALLAALSQHPQLAIAEPAEDERRQAPAVGQVGDLGAEIDRGAKWLTGEPDDTDGKSPTSVSPQLASGKPGQFRPQYALSGADIDPNVINTIAGEASTRDPAAIDAVINNMFNRLGSKGYGPSANLFEVARAPGQYTGYRKASPTESAFIQSRIQAIANGSIPDNTNGSMEYRGAWLYNKAANLHPDGTGVGGNWFFKTPVQPGPYAARQTDTEEAGNESFPRSSPVPAPPIPQDQSTAPRGHLKITDPNSDPLTSHAYPAPGETSGVPSSPPVQVTNPSPPPSQGPPATSLPDASGGPLSQAGPDPMSNPNDNPQAPLDPDAPQARRGGYMKRAKGGSIESMPTDELIAYALERIRKHRAAGGATAAPAPTLDSLSKQNDALQQQQAQDEARAQAVNSQLGDQARNQIIGAEQNGGRGSVQSAIDQPEAMLQTLWSNPSPRNQSQQQPPPTTTPSGPAIPNGQVGNTATVTGSPIGGVPNATPAITPSSSTDPTGPQYNNTLDQALGTNSPSMDQIFGFNYPTIPPPKPQPVGPVSQKLINNLYGFGGGSQMGTGTGMGAGGFASGGAIVMDAALNKARKAIKGKRHV